MRAQILSQDDRDFSTIRWVAGVDISFDPKDSDHACAYISIYEAHKPLGPPVYEDHILDKVKVPYESGFLGFREVPFYLTLFERLQKVAPQYWPDVVFVDGFGILHPRGCGSASHLGLKLGLPTVGIAKTLLCHDGLHEDAIKRRFRKQCQSPGSFVPLVGKSGQTYGGAYKSTNETQNPIYISVGHKVSLITAIAMIGPFCQYRIPEPIRNSDIKSKLYFESQSTISALA